MYKLLLLEDETVIRKQLKLLLERNNFEVTGAGTLEEAVALYPESFDVIVADIRLPDGDGNQILNYCEQVPVIMMTSYSTIRSAVESIKRGAVDFISKPFNHEELLQSIAHSLPRNRISTQNAAMKRDLNRCYPLTELGTQSVTMQHTISGLKSLGTEELFVYLHGERGVGKELLARECHKFSDRSSGPLVFTDIPIFEHSALNTALVEADLRMPILSRDLLRSASGGTLVIRNINKLSPEKQYAFANLLIEAKNHQRIPNVRLIVLSADNPTTAINEGLLHPSLGSLFNQTIFQLPPLRERRDDIAKLSAEYLHRFAKRYRKRRIALSDEASLALQSYDWPGNINELKCVIERAVLMVDSEEIRAVHLGLKMTNGEVAHAGLGLSLDAYFRFHVLQSEGHLSETELATKLGISRKTLWERRQKMDLPRHVQT